MIMCIYGDNELYIQNVVYFAMQRLSIHASHVENIYDMKIICAKFHYVIRTDMQEPIMPKIAFPD